ncbi:hypothetical protein CEXT_259941 [Caerostris extrusa]|uniref:Uncharacterized protein n=1 Tax=Caerostris extrusa TaxID=172846 RepID=A0AAV4TQN1_CAEEX|nr:hypothetical protein CEXT_259941 [Caerostris extrusa]
MPTAENQTIGPNRKISYLPVKVTLNVLARKSFRDLVEKGRKTLPLKPYFWMVPNFTFWVTCSKLGWQNMGTEHQPFFCDSTWNGLIC